MTTRTSTPVGAPCWVDLWTSDVEGSRRFYRDLFGWEAEEPNPAYGGYFMFSRDGVPVAGGMGPMDGKATDSWSVYLCSEDVEATLKKAVAEGGTVLAPATPVDELGVQAVAVDPTGASVGLWQPKQFPGLTVLGEVGTPSWFELRTASFAEAVAFYRAVLGIVFAPGGDAADAHYATFRSPEGGEDLGGVMDDRDRAASGGASWSVYFETDDLDAALARLRGLGGSVLDGPDDTPWGRLAEVSDPAGAAFRLRTAPSSGS